MSLTQVIKSMTKGDEMVGALQRVSFLVGGCFGDHTDGPANAKTDLWDKGSAPKIRKGAAIAAPLSITIRLPS
jgi:hypothetical protein